MNKRLLDALADIWSYDREGYPFCWKMKSRAKLQEMGLVYSERSRHWNNEPAFYLTEAGKKLLHREKEKSG